MTASVTKRRMVRKTFDVNSFRAGSRPIITAKFEMQASQYFLDHCDDEDGQILQFVSRYGTCFDGDEQLT